MKASEAKEVATKVVLQQYADRLDVNKHYQALQEQISKEANAGQFSFSMSTVLPEDFAEDKRVELEEALNALKRDGFSVATGGDRLVITWK